MALFCASATSTEWRRPTPPSDVGLQVHQCDAVLACSSGWCSYACRFRRRPRRGAAWNGLGGLHKYGTCLTCASASGGTSKKTSSPFSRFPITGRAVEATSRPTQRRGSERCAPTTSTAARSPTTPSPTTSSAIARARGGTYSELLFLESLVGNRARAGRRDHARPPRVSHRRGRDLRDAARRRTLRTHVLAGRLAQGKANPSRRLDRSPARPRRGADRRLRGLQRARRPLRRTPSTTTTGGSGTPLGHPRSSWHERTEHLRAPTVTDHVAKLSTFPEALDPDLLRSTTQVWQRSANRSPDAYNERRSRRITCARGRQPGFPGPSSSGTPRSQATAESRSAHSR